jgi:hypothetical protein
MLKSRLLFIPIYCVQVNREKQSLMIRQLDKSLAGNYTCIVKNMYGTIMHSFRYMCPSNKDAEDAAAFLIYLEIYGSFRDHASARHSHIHIYRATIRSRL